MKLSEALRLGEFALPPTKGAWFTRRLSSGKLCGACAVGRAVYAAGFRPRELPLKDRLERMRKLGVVGHFGDEYERLKSFIARHWPWTRVYTKDRMRLTDLPMEYQYNAVMAEISNHYEVLNASMNQLADYIETLEAKYDTNVTIPVPTTKQLEEVR